MHKALFMVALVAALALPVAAQARSGPPVICGTACDGGGGGWSGCTQQSASHSANLGVVRIDHYLIVSYCKSYGVITSISIAAHGCDTAGFVSCTTGPAWQTGGGVGYGFATFEARANWTVLLPPFTSNDDHLSLSVSLG